MLSFQASFSYRSSRRTIRYQEGTLPNHCQSIVGEFRVRRDGNASSRVVQDFVGLRKSRQIDLVATQYLLEKEGKTESDTSIERDVRK